METQEYYKIKTPLFSSYKPADGFRQGYIKLGALTERLALGSRSGFQLPVIGDITFRSVREFLSYSPHDAALRWYDANSERLTKLRNIILKLKTYNPNDLYFYINGLHFAMGCLNQIPGRISRTFPSALMTMFCYCTDFPEDAFSQLPMEAVLPEFSAYLPLPLEAWPGMRTSRNATGAEKQRFDEYGCLLLEYMVELWLLIVETCPELRETASTQIRCYYKWLKKHGLYPSRYLQELIYSNL